jgi:hypothetical protein
LTQLRIETCKMSHALTNEVPTTRCPTPGGQKMSAVGYGVNHHARRTIPTCSADPYCTVRCCREACARRRWSCTVKLWPHALCNHWGESSASSMAVKRRRCMLADAQHAGHQPARRAARVKVSGFELGQRCNKRTSDTEKSSQLVGNWSWTASRQLLAVVCTPSTTPR